MCVNLITHHGAVRSCIQVRTNERTFFVRQLKCLIKSVRAEHARIEKEERDHERERRRLARARTTATAQAVPGTQVAPPTPNGARPPPATPAAPKKPTVSAAQPTSANRALRNEFAQFAQEIMELVNEPLVRTCHVRPSEMRGAEPGLGTGLYEGHGSPGFGDPTIRLFVY